ncbi:hypothetical protein NE857_18715 [Nocardiopsis exhalans]|uniref:Transcriptional regulator SbtR-like C-terminal domain-containing protein n=1 Tax=Nocardiopsis exhalans TaxID=163604 RepID=A0ABY5D287_9ACTN|nr:hypothetical protein [Nocardiopsis exhalans]USY17378.1 hypothetical protein NE857_18715 [Nocardiopsis exhalans]
MPRTRIEELLDRARRAGAVREDISLDAVRLLFSSVAGIVGEPDPHRRAQRVVGHFLSSFATEEAPEPRGWRDVGPRHPCRERCRRVLTGNGPRMIHHADGGCGALTQWPGLVRVLGLRQG